MRSHPATDCTDCSRRWQHCHGTWVQHADGSGECTDRVSCAVPAEGHPDVVRCADTVGGCCGQHGSGT